MASTSKFLLNQVTKHIVSKKLKLNISNFIVRQIIQIKKLVTWEDRKALRAAPSC